MVCLFWGENGHWAGSFRLSRVGSIDPSSIHGASRVCQNIEIHLTKSKISQSEAASHFQGDLMTRISSIDLFIERLLLLWKLR
jgi:hypothetical protein